MIRRQARFLGKPVRASANTRRNSREKSGKSVNFLKQMHEYVDETGVSRPRAP